MLLRYHIHNYKLNFRLMGNYMLLTISSTQFFCTEICSFIPSIIGTVSVISSDPDLHAKMACPIHNGTFKNFVSISMKWISMFITSKTYYFQLWFLYKSEDIKELSEWNTFNLRKFFCKTDIFIFVWRVPWYYAYSPLQIIFIYKCCVQDWRPSLTFKSSKI